MRTLRRTLTPLGFAVLLFAAVTSIAGATASAITARAAGPIVHVSWHRLAGGVESVYADGGGNYLALTTEGDGSGFVSLFDTQTGVRTLLSPPGCPYGGRPAGFGGPWFAMGCQEPGFSEQADLYDLASGTWTQIPVGLAACGAIQIPRCSVARAGTTWLRFFYSPDLGGCAHICDSIGYLQNLATGAIEIDPASDFRTDTLDDLNSPSGIAPHPCPNPPSSAYSLPSGDPGDGWQQLGHFGLESSNSYTTGFSTSELYKCHSKLRLRLSGTWFGTPRAIVSQATFGPDSQLIEGRWLPSLEPFVTRRRGLLSAVSNRTLYSLQGGSLWEGTLPDR